MARKTASVGEEREYAEIELEPGLYIGKLFNSFTMRAKTGRPMLCTRWLVYDPDTDERLATWTLFRPPSDNNQMGCRRDEEEFGLEPGSICEDETALKAVARILNAEHRMEQHPLVVLVSKDGRRKLDFATPVASDQEDESVL